MFYFFLIAVIFAISFIIYLFLGMEKKYISKLSDFSSDNNFVRNPKGLFPFTKFKSTNENDAVIVYTRDIDSQSIYNKSFDGHSSNIFSLSKNHWFIVKMPVNKDHSKSLLDSVNSVLEKMSWDFCQKKFCSGVSSVYKDDMVLVFISVPYYSNITWKKVSTLMSKILDQHN